MRTAKLFLSAVALALITFLIEPATAANSNSTTATIELLQGTELGRHEGHREVVLAGMVAFLTALLLLRRHRETS
jgi:hypothetical protein